MSDHPLNMEELRDYLIAWARKRWVVALVWRKTTTAICLTVILLTSMIWIVPMIRNRLPPPPPSQAALQRMLREIPERDAAVRQRMAGQVGRSADMPGVFESIRDNRQVPPEQVAPEQKPADPNVVPNKNVP